MTDKSDIEKSQEYRGKMVSALKGPLNLSRLKSFANKHGEMMDSDLRNTILNSRSENSYLINKIDELKKGYSID